MFDPLVHNVALLTALCLVQWLLLKRLPRHGYRPWIEGVLFGLVAAGGMALPVWHTDGIFFDGRSVILSLAAFFFGPIAGIVAGIIAGIYRLWQGGSGAPVGLLVIATSVALGWLGGRLVRPETSSRFLFLPLLLLGLTVHGAAIGLFALLPVDFHDIILGHVAVPYLCVFTVATAAIGILLREFEDIGRVRELFDESEDRFRRLFDSAAISLWDEDLTGLLEALEALRRQGVSDLRDHLRDEPRLLEELAAKVRINRVNPATLALFAASSRRDFENGLARTFTPSARETFLEELCALWEGQTLFRSETTFRTLDNRELQAVLSAPLPATMSAARSVPVSILDVTDINAARASLQHSKRTLEEILWGTRAGTWEWNVQTGATAFNERWAEIIGYTLEELQPVSIATWQRFCHPDDLERSDAELQKVFAREQEFYDCDTRMRHKDGHWMWISDRGKVVEWLPDGRPLRMSGTHTDITRRKTSEAELERLAAMRATLLACHGAIARTRVEGRLLQALCDILVEHRHHPLVWIGIPEHDGNRLVRPVAVAGELSDYLDGLEIKWADLERGGGPTGTAVRLREPRTLNATKPEEADAPWSQRMTRFGLRSSVAVPACADDRVLAVITVYSRLEDAFDTAEVALLSEFAGNLGLALAGMRLNDELRRVSSALQRSSLSVVEAVAATLEQRDPYTAGHQERVAKLSVAIAQELGWGHERIEGLRLGALIHDIGKISVPAEILNRPGKLSPAEFEIIKTHPVTGADILKSVAFPWPIREMVLQHHERIDGSGYPEGLKGDAIIEEAKVLCVADVVEAIASHRPYRPALGLEEGLKEIERGRGTRYDTAISDACLRLIREQRFTWSAVGNEAAAGG